eukprot:985569-Pyramimonas_sp.AAC.1
MKTSVSLETSSASPHVKHLPGRPGPEKTSVSLEPPPTLQNKRFTRDILNKLCKTNVSLEPSLRKDPPANPFF